MIKTFSILFLLLGLSWRAQGQTYKIRLSMCVDSYCSESTNNGNESPLYSTGNKDLDQARWDAYRNEMTEQYEQAITKLQVETVKWAEEKQKSENLSPIEFQTLKNEALGALVASLPPLPPQLPTLKERREQNPYPSISSKQDLDKKIDNIWNEIEKASPIAVAKSLQAQKSSYIVPAGTPPAVAQEMARRYEFLNKEMVLSRVTDSQGLLRAPFVETPDVRLKTSGQTQLGNRLRGDINRTIANQSVVYAKCQQANADTESCAQVQEYHQMTTMTLYAMDRWGSSFPDGATSNQYNYILKSLETEIAFVEGFVEGSVEMVNGAIQIVRHPVETASALGSALWNYEETYDVIVEVAKSTWEDFKNTDAAGKAYFVGRASFEVLSAVVPAGKVGWVEKVCAASPMLMTATYESMKVLYLAEKMHVQNLDELVAVVGLQRQVMSNTGMVTELVQTNLLTITRNSFESYSKALAEAGGSLSSSAENYLAKQVGYSTTILKGGEYTTTELVSMSQSYMRIEGDLDTIVGISIDSIMYRAVPSSWGLTGEHVFNVNDLSILANNRYSPPGELALHAVLGGEASAAFKIATKEAGMPAESLVFAQQKIKADNILDLTNPDVLTKLKITAEELVKDDYGLTHQIGHAAQGKFKGIIAPSAKQSGGVNIILFGGIP